MDTYFALLPVELREMTARMLAGAAWEEEQQGSEVRSVQRRALAKIFFRGGGTPDLRKLSCSGRILYQRELQRINEAGERQAVLTYNSFQSADLIMKLAYPRRVYYDKT